MQNLHPNKKIVNIDKNVKENRSAVETHGYDFWFEDVYVKIFWEPMFFSGISFHILGLK